MHYSNYTQKITNINGTVNNCYLLKTYLNANAPAAPRVHPFKAAPFPYHAYAYQVFQLFFSASSKSRPRLQRTTSLFKASLNTLQPSAHLNRFEFALETTSRKSFILLLLSYHLIATTITMPSNPTVTVALKWGLLHKHKTTPI